MGKSKILVGVLALVVMAWGLGLAEASRIGGPWEVTAALAPGQQHVFQHTFDNNGGPTSVFVFRQFAGSTQIRGWLQGPDARWIELDPTCTNSSGARTRTYTVTVVVRNVGTRTTTYNLKVR